MARNIVAYLISCASLRFRLSILCPPRNGVDKFLVSQHLSSLSIPLSLAEFAPKRLAACEPAEDFVDFPVREWALPIVWGSIQKRVT